MDKTTFLSTLKSGRAQWEGLLAQVDESRMAQAGVSGYMSLKDVIAHVTWHEREMIGVVEQRGLVGSEWWNLPTDERNKLIYEANRERPLNDVKMEAKRVYDHFFEVVESLSDEELNNPANFHDMPADWMPWKLIAENSYEHYEQHEPDIHKWLAEQTLLTRYE
jgi:hypothetical protein